MITLISLILKNIIVIKYYMINKILLKIIRSRIIFYEISFINLSD